MSDDVFAELVEWWEDITIGGIGSGIVVVPVPAGWGRTALLDSFVRRVESDQRSSVLLRIDGLDTPPGPGPLAAWLGDRSSGDRLLALARQMFGFDRPEAFAALSIEIAGQTIIPILGGPLGLVITVGLGAESVLRNTLFPDPPGRATRVGNRLARTSMQGPVTVVIDDAEALDVDVADGFVSGLLDRAGGHVLVVLAADPDCELLSRLKGPNRMDRVGDRVFSVEVPDAAMRPEDRRRVGVSLVPDWPTAAVDRLILRTRTFNEVRKVTSARGAADIADSPDAVAAVDRLVEALIPLTADSRAAVVVAWCGGVLHPDQLQAALEVAGPDALAPGHGLGLSPRVVRLEHRADLSRLGALVHVHLDSRTRRAAAEAIANMAAGVIVRPGADLIETLAALRPIPALLSTGEPPDLAVTAETLLLCAQLIDLLRGAGDARAAADLASLALSLAAGGAVVDPVIDRLAAAALALAAELGDSPGDLVGSVTDPDNAALFGVETRLWASVHRLQDPSTRSEGIGHAEDLIPELDTAVFGPEAYLWRLHLGAALARSGALDLTGAALAPLLALPDGDELHLAAERVAETLTGPGGDILLAAQVLEESLQSTAPKDAERRLELTSALSELYRRVGAWQVALTYVEEELSLRRRLQGPDHVDTLMTRNNHAYLVGEAGDRKRALMLAEQLLPDLIRVLGRDHSFTLVARSHIASMTGRAGNPQRAKELFEQLLTDETRVLGLLDRKTLMTRGNIATWTGEAGNSARALVLLEQLLPDQVRALGQDHLQTLTTRLNIADRTGASRSPVKALTMCGELLPDVLRVLGADHPTTLSARHQIARWTGETGDALQALILDRELLRDQIRVLGADHPDTLLTRSNIAGWTGEAGDSRQALALYTALRPDLTRVLGPEHPQTLACRFNIASWTTETSQFDDALALHQQLLPDLTRVLGHEHALTRASCDYIDGSTGKE